VADQWPVDELLDLAGAQNAATAELSKETT
jgi:hypothetical protein